MGYPFSPASGHMKNRGWSDRLKDTDFMLSDCGPPSGIHITVTWPVRKLKILPDGISPKIDFFLLWI